MRFFLICLTLISVGGCTGYYDAMKPKYGEEEKKPDKEPEAKVAEKEKPKAKGNIVGKLTNEVFDYHKKMAENPELVEVEPVFTAGDPITTARTGYLSQTARISKIAFEKSMQLYMVEHGDKPPTYTEFKEMMDRDKLEYAMLPFYQMYAYEEKAGKLVILEDPEQKPKR